MNDYSDAAATFGDRLALAREAQGLSQQQLARRLGLRVETVRNWEADRSEPRANKLQMLAGFLNVSMVWLMTGEGAGAPASESGGGDTVTDLGTAIEELRTMRLEHRKLAERMGYLEKRLRGILEQA